MAIRQPATPAIVPEGDEWTHYHGKKMTEAEFLALDDAYETDLEYYDGAAWEKGLVDFNHGSATTEVLARFWMFARSAGGHYGPERRVRLPNGQDLKPDAAYWIPGIPYGNDTLPTVAVEVRSPDDTIASQRRKCRKYRAGGVPVVWLVDPIRRVAEVFEGELDAEPLPPDGVLKSELLPGFELPISDIWAALD